MGYEITKVKFEGHACPHLHPHLKMDVSSPDEPNSGGLPFLLL
jgi:hypothetical protein